MRPFCQATGCFDLADLSLFLMKPEPDYCEVGKESDYEKAEKVFGETEFDGFKMILNMCVNHDSEFKSLFRGSELRIAKWRNPPAPEIS